ncbi:MAG: type II secretion system protein [Phycisphaerae bacterium]|nr:type II secretion system protein [Phycisphaerae bacterium]
MRNRRTSGFTLVEILIVVVILGILAAIVIPQFTSASQEAIKGALQSQLQTISSQVELYRVRNAGQLPDNAAEADPVGVAASENGWGVLVAGQYLKEQPFNGFTGSSALDVGTEGDQLAANVKTGNGWVFHDDSTAQNGIVFAYGFDGTFLSTEAGYTPANTIP